MGVSNFNPLSTSLVVAACLEVRGGRAARAADSERQLVTYFRAVWVEGGGRTPSAGGRSARGRVCRPTGQNDFVHRGPLGLGGQMTAESPEAEGEGWRPRPGAQ